MLEFMRDAGWQFWGLVATIFFGIIAVVVTVIIYLMQRAKKELSYSFSNVALLRVDGPIQSRVEILFDGSPVKNVHLLSYKVINTGNTSIKPEDIAVPINVQFDKNINLFEVNSVETNPQSILKEEGVITCIDGSKLIIKRILLNKGESFTVGIIASQEGGSILEEQLEIGARIEGVKRLKPFIIDSEPELTFSVIFAVVVCLIVAGITIFIPPDGPNGYWVYMLGFFFWLFQG